MNPNIRDYELSALKELNKSLFPTPQGGGNGIKLKAVRKLTAKEVQVIFEVIEHCNLLTSMFSANMFGGYGINVYDHESYPGTGPTHLLTITEFDLPPEMNAKDGQAAMGSGSEDAWNLFSKYTHSDQNRAWLKMYKMSEPQERYYYDY